MATLFTRGGGRGGPGALAPDAILRTVREALELPYAAITLREGDEFVMAAESDDHSFFRDGLRMLLQATPDTEREAGLGRGGERL